MTDLSNRYTSYAFCASVSLKSSLSFKYKLWEREAKLHAT